MNKVKHNIKDGQQFTYRENGKFKLAEACLCVGCNRIEPINACTVTNPSRDVKSFTVLTDFSIFTDGIEPETFLCSDCNRSNVNEEITSS